jgi:putative proteasome-type protease
MIHRSWGEKLREAFNSIAEPSWSGANKSSDISIPAKKIGAVPINHPPTKSALAKSRVSAKTSKSTKRVLTKKLTPQKKVGK